MNMVKYYDVKIQTEPFTEQQIDDDLKNIDLVYHLNSAKKKRIKKWLKEHKDDKFWDEEVIYVHRYPKTEDTIIGVKRLTELDYFI